MRPPKAPRRLVLALVLGSALLGAAVLGLSAEPVQAEGLADIEAGHAAAQAGQLEEALALFTSAIKSGDLRGADLAKAYNNRGNVQAALGETKRSLQDLNRAILIDPNYTAAYYNRAITRQDLGEFDKALEDYSAVLEINPEHVAALFYRGLIRERLGRRRDAKEDFLKAYELAPDDITVKSKLQSMGLLEGQIE